MTLEDLLESDNGRTIKSEFDALADEYAEKCRRDPIAYCGDLYVLVLLKDIVNGDTCIFPRNISISEDAYNHDWTGEIGKFFVSEILDTETCSDVLAMNDDTAESIGFAFDNWAREHDEET